jgi:phospholipid:diacylglycerol acyltransferase
MAQTRSQKKKNKEETTKASSNAKWIALAILLGASAISVAIFKTSGIGPDGFIANDTFILNINDDFNSSYLSQLPFDQLFKGYLGEDFSFQTKWQELQKRLTEDTSSADPVVGSRMKTQGHAPKHPVFMVPGFVTAGLELWQGEECAQQYFRRKVWGSFDTFRTFVADKACWQRHLSLDPKTGLDPAGIRLRNSQGFEAADFWTDYFWVWDRMISNLAEIGYDGSTMSMEPYDWRLDYKLLEQRDGHFTKLKKKIEAFVEYSGGTKAVIMGHSMGGPHVFFFLVWVGKPKEEGGGGGGPDWVEKHIHAYLDLAGPMMGLPKAASALLSGEMQDTNMLGPIGGLMESIFGRRKRHDMFASWGALWGMAPKGGNSVWGPAADVDCGEGRIQSGSTCVDANGDVTPYIPLMKFRDEEIPDYQDPLFQEYGAKAEWSFDEFTDYMSQWKSGDSGPKTLVDAWNDPTLQPLPNAPSLNVYCMYGVGLPTSRMYHYKRQPASEHDLPFLMDDEKGDDPAENVTYGVKMVDGDGSVPLLSTGYPCVELWKEGSPMNPGNARVVTREYQHQGSFQPNDPMRQGPKSSEHCDILGNHDFLGDIIKIVSGNSVEARIHSDIENIAKRIREHPINSEGASTLEGHGEHSSDEGHGQESGGNHEERADASRDESSATDEL